MKEELIEFAKYYSGSVLGKLLALYVLPSLVLGLRLHDEVSFTYLKWAIPLLNAFNVINQFLFGTRYKRQSMKLAKKYAVALPVGTVVYAYVCLALGAYLFSYSGVCENV